MADRRSLIGRWFGRTRARPMQTVGAPGVAIHGGYPESFETSKQLATHDARYKTYGDILANTAIVAAGVRYFLNLVGSSVWTFTPSEADTDGMYAERLEAMLISDPDTPWHRIMRRAAMYRFYGFSIQEWTMKRHEEGYLTFQDVAPRPQRTIEQWDTDETGRVLGVVQRTAQDSQYVYLPRSKVLYIVDDSLHDSPEGLGLFRHLVEPAMRLERYTQLEGYGFEADLQGVPVAYAPFTEMAQLVKQGKITNDDRKRIEKPLRDFMAGHKRGPKLGLFLDSAVYAGEGENRTPTAVRQWELDLLKGSSVSFKENASAIERLNRELARILGVEQLLLGATTSGSFALSEDKTHAFYQTVESALTEIREAVDSDLITLAWDINGWPEEMRPEATTDAVRYRDVAEIATVLRDMASAGAVMEPDDPAINDVRDLSGVARIDLDAMRERADEDAALRQEELKEMRIAQPGGDDDVIPEGDE